MRRAARVDDNHGATVKVLRGAGCTVQSLAPVGDGCPDLLVGFKGVNWVLEVKDGAKPPSARRLTPAEQDWHAVWQGQVAVVESPEEALRLVCGALP